MEQKNRVIYYPCDNDKIEPLVVIMGFANCSERILKKYKEIWDKYGFNSILYYPSLDVSMSLIRYQVIEVLKCIHNHFVLMKNKNVENYEKTNEIIIHGISAGTMSTPILLRYMDTLDNGKYQYLIPFIKGIILDSGVPIEINHLQIAYINSLKEVSQIKENLNNPLVKFMCENSNIYKPLWNEYVTTDLPYLYNSKFKYLIIYSDNDHFFKGIPEIIIDRINSKNNEMGKYSNNILKMNVTSPHSQHYRYNPELYEDCVKQLLKLSIKL